MIYVLVGIQYVISLLNFQSKRISVNYLIFIKKNILLFLNTYLYNLHKMYENKIY